MDLIVNEIFFENWWLAYRKDNGTNVVIHSDGEFQTIHLECPFDTMEKLIFSLYEKSNQL